MKNLLSFIKSWIQDVKYLTQSEIDSTILHQVHRKRRTPSCPKRCLKGECLGYIAPELIWQPLATPTPASDWWSVGALVYHWLSGRSLRYLHPTGVTSNTELCLPPHTSVEARNLIGGLLSPHPGGRLGGGVSGGQDVRMHPFFEGVAWNSPT